MIDKAVLHSCELRTLRWRLAHGGGASYRCGVPAQKQEASLERRMMATSPGDCDLRIARVELTSFARNRPEKELDWVFVESSELIDVVGSVPFCCRGCMCARSAEDEPKL